MRKLLIILLILALSCPLVAFMPSSVLAQSPKIWIDDNYTPATTTTDTGAQEYKLLIVPPPLPHAFYGDLLINGSPAQAGTKVEVKGTGVITGTDSNPIWTAEIGKYGTPGPTGAKLIAQGYTIEDGTLLAFYVDDVFTGQTFPFQSGDITELDLIIPSAPPPAPVNSLITSSTGGGHVETPGEEGPYYYPPGFNAPLLAVPDDCFVFVEWTGDISAVDNATAAETFITMSDNYTITANFALKVVELTTDSTAGGSVTTPGEGTYPYDCGTTDVPIVATADLGYVFTEWTGETGKIDDTSAASTTIDMDDDYSITANFEWAPELEDVEIQFNLGWNTFSTPISLHDCVDTWDEFILYNSLNITAIYGYDATAEQWISLGGGEEIEPLYGFYVKTSAAGTANIIPNVDQTPLPTRDLSRGLHLIGVAPASMGDYDVVSALTTIYLAPNAYMGYTLVVSPYINSPNDWSYIRDGADPPDTNIGRAYWLVMENADQYVGETSTPYEP